MISVVRPKPIQVKNGALGVCTDHGTFTDQGTTDADPLCSSRTLISVFGPITRYCLPHKIVLHRREDRARGCPLRQSGEVRAKVPTRECKGCFGEELVGGGLGGKCDMIRIHRFEVVVPNAHLQCT